MFGFSSSTTFTVTNFARGAIAVGSVASGIGLTIDAWFLLAYCNTTPAKFQVSPLFSSLKIRNNVALHPVPENGPRRLRQISVFLYFSTNTGTLHVFICSCADDFSDVGSVDRMA